MRLLLKLAFQHGKRLSLLFITFAFLMVVTVASQMEMLSLGVITSSGADVFRLFGKEQEQVVSLDEVQQQWHLVGGDADGVLTGDAAKRYLSTQRERNPLKKIFNIWSAKTGLESNIPLLAALLVIIAIFKGVSMFGSQYYKQLIMIQVSRDMRKRYFEHIHTLPLSFYAKYNVGSLSSRVQTDAMQIAQGIYAGITAYLQTPFMVVSALGICLYLSFELSLIVFVAFPLVVLPIMYFAKKVKRVARRLLQNNEALSTVLIECLSGIHTVKLFGREKLSMEKFEDENNQLAELEAKSARYGFMARPILHASATFMLSGIMLYGIYFAHMSLSEILVFCGMIFLIYEPLKRLNDEVLLIQKGSAAAERMMEVLSIESDIIDQTDAIDLEDFRDRVEYKNISFRYGNEQTLTDVSFAVKRGEMAAIVGPTGAGKSTIIHLLPRLYEATGGEILIDGRPLTGYTQKSLREKIAVVSQKPFFFCDTVAANIAFGGDYTREEIVAATKRAHAHEFVAKLPNGYDTVLSERGKDLSGGQQQRLAIARALVRRSPILILDEATSALDALSENHIKEALHDLRGEITQIVIAHRLSTIEDADQIIFLDEGKVTGQGKCDELIASHPAFQQMWSLLHKQAPAVSLS